MINTLGIEDVVESAEWHVHRTHGDLCELEFVNLPRASHRSITFLEEKSFAPGIRRVRLPFDAVAAAVEKRDFVAPRFIVHSSMAASTLLARVFDAPGVSMSLAEPIILNELAALHLRGRDVRRELAIIIRLLSRPFAPGEGVVIKPGNTANLLMPLIAADTPGMAAVCIEAPVRDFLRSIAKKGIEGRIVYRRLYAFLNRAISIPTGFTPEDVWEQTDLQIAAMTWLLQHAQMTQMLKGAQFRSVDSATFLAGKLETVTALADHFRLELDAKAVMSSGVFEAHAKELGRSFNAAQREAEYREVDVAYGDEISKVAFWIEKVAEHVGLGLRLPRPLLALNR